MSFIIPIGDSFPATTTHSLVGPPINVESGLDDANSSTATNTASAIPTPGGSVAPSAGSPTAGDTVPTSFSDGQPEPLHPVAIVGIVLLVLTVTGILLFLVRRQFVIRRASKVTPARSRASNIVISGPTDFQHVATASRHVNLGDMDDKRPTNAGTPHVGRWNPHSQPSQRPATDATKGDEPWATTEGPRDKNKQKYSVNFSTLESGLHDHVQTMRSAWNPRHDSS